MRNNTHVLGSTDDGVLHNNKGDQNIRDIGQKKPEEYRPTYMYLSLLRTGSLKSLMRSSASSLTTVCSSRYLRGIFCPSSFTVFDSETKAAFPVSGKMLTNTTLSLFQQHLSFDLSPCLPSWSSCSNSDILQSDKAICHFSSMHSLSKIPFCESFKIQLYALSFQISPERNPAC